jgi:acyl-CoA thioester hydrolase
VRVRYAETDRMGVAYYANYLIWFEVARSEYCRQMGFSYAEMEQESSCVLVVTQAQCRYRRSVTYEDELIIRTWLKDLKKRAIVFAYRIIRADDGRIAAEGETQHVVVDRTGKPISMPDRFFRLLKNGCTE